MVSPDLSPEPIARTGECLFVLELNGKPEVRHKPEAGVPRFIRKPVGRGRRQGLPGPGGNREHRLSPQFGARFPASFALENDLRFPVVKDEEYEVCAALGVDCVPQVAVLDRGNRLVYRGRINDQYRISGTQPSARREDLATALDELLAGKPISVKKTAVDGCKVTPPSARKFEPPIATWPTSAPSR